MRCSCNNTTRLVLMMILVAVYFFVELIVGYLVNSLALVADAFHMFSDFLALIIGLIATRIAKWPRSSKNTYGWQRAEVMGGLINTVVLITLCVTLFIKAIDRMINPSTIDDPEKLFYVGVGGLVINILGLAVLGSHSHGGSHKPHVVIETALDANHLDVITVAPAAPDSDFFPNDPPAYESAMNANSTVIEKNGQAVSDPSLTALNPDDKEETPSVVVVSTHDHTSMNMRAVFLHVLADFFGSIIVCVSALLLWLVPGEGRWKLYIDPCMSLLMVFIIIANAGPLAYKAILILLQYVPSEISIKELNYRLENLDGVHSIHDLHVWPLKSDLLIGTVHVRCSTLPDYLQVLQRVKTIFHQFNIHCTTIQPEFGDHPTNLIGTDVCVLDCLPDKTCQTTTCCPIGPGGSGVLYTVTQMPQQPAPTSASSASSPATQRALGNGPNSAVVVPLVSPNTSV